MRISGFLHLFILLPRVTRSKGESKMYWKVGCPGQSASIILVVQGQTKFIVGLVFADVI